MHAPFLGLKVNSYSACLQEKFEGKGQDRPHIVIDTASKSVGEIVTALLVEFREIA
jgi:hypothetical protein